jgi:hypothetical protein
MNESCGPRTMTVTSSALREVRNGATDAAAVERGGDDNAARQVGHSALGRPLPENALAELTAIMDKGLARASLH